jgi:hypothetical protein
MPEIDSCNAFQAASCFRRDLARGKTCRDDQRGFTRGVAQQPGGLLDLQELIDRRVLVIDIGGKHAGELFEPLEQHVRDVYIFLVERRTPRGLRLAHCFPELLLQGRDRLECAIEFGNQRIVLRELHRDQQREAIGHGGHLAIAQAAQVLFDVGVHRIRVQQTAGGRAVGAEVMHRLEKVRRGVGDHRDPARRLQVPPGFPCAHRKLGDGQHCGDHNNGLEQRGNG